MKRPAKTRRRPLRHLSAFPTVQQVLGAWVRLVRRHKRQRAPLGQR